MTKVMLAGRGPGKCHCGANATVYAGGPYAGDWAGAYCNQHIPDGFQVWDRFDNEGTK